jgi:quercetin dioxygenase-like cupin family protein
MTDRGRKFDVLNILMNFHAFPDETGGKYCLVECLVPPGAGAPPNHHAGETEAFYILEGEVGFSVDGQDRLARAGDFVPIPDGAVHAFRAVGDGPARLLILNAPGHMHAQFFTGVGRPLPASQTGLPDPVAPDLGAVMEMAQRAGMTILPPA